MNFNELKDPIVLWLFKHSRLSRFSTARGPDPWYNQAGTTKVGACKSFLFTESSLVVKIKKTIV